MKRGVLCLVLPALAACGSADSDLPAGTAPTDDEAQALAKAEAMLDTRTDDTEPPPASAQEQ